MANQKIVLWVLGLSFLFLGSCEQDKPKIIPLDQKPSGMGLKVVRAGEDPSHAPGAKGQMIDMKSDEVRVLLVNPQGPAAEAGFAPGDRILAGDGIDLASEDDLKEVLAKADKQKVFFEVHSDKRILTLPLTTSRPGWLVLSGDTFKGFLLTRIQSGRKKPEPRISGPAPDMNLPAFDGPDISLKALHGSPVALLFWGTFSEQCYAHLQALTKVCEQYAPRGLKCLAVNTMELFTAVSKTRSYANEVYRVRKEFFPKGSMGIDLFLEAERQFGVSGLPTLLLIDKEGKIVGRHDGPFSDPFDNLPRALKPILPESPIE